MKIGDVVYFKERMSRSTGYIPCGDSFHTSEFPELAIIYEWQYNYPDNVKWMSTPNMAVNEGMIPHVVGALKLDHQQ